MSNFLVRAASVAPKVLFNRMLKLMSEDAGTTFKATPQQRSKAELAIGVMLDKGWDPTSVTSGLSEEYLNDLEVLACGEDQDIKKVVKKWSGQVLNAILGQIFNSAPQEYQKIQLSDAQRKKALTRLARALPIKTSFEKSTFIGEELQLVLVGMPAPERDMRELKADFRKPIKMLLDCGANMDTYQSKSTWNPKFYFKGDQFTLTHDARKSGACYVVSVVSVE